MTGNGRGNPERDVRVGPLTGRPRESGGLHSDGPIPSFKGEETGSGKKHNAPAAMPGRFDGVGLLLAAPTAAGRVIMFRHARHIMGYTQHLCKKYR
jgi:hypothetical protein